jgi:hypothetical protein
LDPFSIGSLDPDPDSWQAKMIHKKRKKGENFTFEVPDVLFWWGWRLLL